jgi:hypothetical protein
MSHKEIAIKIATKFKFEPHLVLAVAENTEGAHPRHDISKCENHLDQEFMDSLDRFEYLSPEYLTK